MQPPVWVVFLHESLLKGSNLEHGGQLENIKQPSRLEVIFPLALYQDLVYNIFQKLHEEGITHIGWTPYLFERPGLDAPRQSLVTGEHFQGWLKIVQNTPCLDQSRQGLLLTLFGQRNNEIGHLKNLAFFRCQ